MDLSDEFIVVGVLHALSCFFQLPSTTHTKEEEEINSVAVITVRCCTQQTPHLLPIARTMM